MPPELRWHVNGVLGGAVWKEAVALARAHVLYKDQLPYTLGKKLDDCIADAEAEDSDAEGDEEEKSGEEDKEDKEDDLGPDELAVG